jgi:DNA-binding NarL/FixJ family response regulator
MHAADDHDAPEPAFATDDTDTVLVGLTLSDRTLALRVRSMISHMATVTLVDIDDADVILTDAIDAPAGPYLTLHTRAAPDSPANGIDRKAGKDLLEAAIRLVAHGYRIAAPHSVHSRGIASDGTTPDTRESLTARERQVLEKLAAGASNKTIARELQISIATAKFHVGSLLAKLGARNRTDAVTIGLKLGLLLL